MKAKLTFTAGLMNRKLETAGRSERWELDEDEQSNSVGTWFCGTLGGVAYASVMRDETKKLIESPRWRSGL